MPFISKDWRSPGEEWVRYEGGWELKKSLTVNQTSDEDLGSGDESDVGVKVIFLQIYLYTAIAFLSR